MLLNEQQSYTWHFDEWSEVEGKLVEFRLVYRGRLPAAGRSEPRNWDKHRIRCELHSQLKNLWRTHPILRDFTSPIERHDGKTLADLKAEQYNRNGFEFLPLIDTRWGLACSLDILFLRRDNPGNLIVSGGDLDNRLKVLFDALKVPLHKDEMPDWEPTEDQKPLCCLMEDDSLITEVKVTTDNYLFPKLDGEGDKDVMLVIHVKTKIVDPNNAFMHFV